MILTALYWLALIVWSAGIAYIILFQILPLFKQAKEPHITHSVAHSKQLLEQLKQTHK